MKPPFTDAFLAEFRPITSYIIFYEKPQHGAEIKQKRQKKRVHTKYNQATKRKSSIRKKRMEELHKTKRSRVVYRKSLGNKKTVTKRRNNKILSNKHKVKSNKTRLGQRTQSNIRLTDKGRNNRRRSVYNGIKHKKRNSTSQKR